MNRRELAELIGNNIRTAREQARMTQRELAAKVGVVQPTMHSWENGLRTIPVFQLMRVAEHLGCSLLRLLGRSDADAYDEGYSDGWKAAQRKAIAVIGTGLAAVEPITGLDTEAFNELLEGSDDDLDEREEAFA